MDNKEKIKLLSDLQAALDNAELKELILNSVSSGKFIYELFSRAVQEELDALLTNTKKEAPAEVDRWSELLKTLDSSLVLKVLESMHKKLDAPAAAPQVSQKPKAAPANFPPEETGLDSQEELKRRWEQQQLVAKKPRGSIAGPL